MRTITESQVHFALSFTRVSLALSVSLTLGVSFVGCDREALDEHGVGVITAPATVCASGPTLFGIDVSKWQGTIDWARVKAAGVEYAFIRVSDGIATIDEKFVPNWQGALAVGIPRGVYQFFRAHRDPVVQADIVIDHLRQHGLGELPPVIDVEATNDQTPETIARNVGLWIDRIESELGVTPIIYTGRFFWNDFVRSTAYSEYPLWHAQYTSAACPNIANVWSDWLIWQYSATGRVDGITGDVDMNRFNGDKARLLSLVGDPVCRAEPNHQGCRGADVEACTPELKLTVIPCAGGTACAKKVMSAGFMCMDPRCSAAVGENGRFCVDDATLGECAGGTFSSGPCSVGESCVDGACLADPVGPAEPGPEPVEPVEDVEPVDVVEAPDSFDSPDTIDSSSATEGEGARVGTVSRGIASREVSPGSSGCAVGGVVSHGLFTVSFIVLFAARRRSRDEQFPATGR